MRMIAKIPVLSWEPGLLLLREIAKRTSRNGSGEQWGSDNGVTQRQNRNQKVVQ